MASPAKMSTSLRRKLISSSQFKNEPFWILISCADYNKSGVRYESEQPIRSRIQLRMLTTNQWYGQVFDPIIDFGQI